MIEGLYEPCVIYSGFVKNHIKVLMQATEGTKGKTLFLIGPNIFVGAGPDLAHKAAICLPLT